MEVLFLNFCGTSVVFFYHNCTNLHSHQECTAVPFSVCPCQHLLSFVFLMTVILHLWGDISLWFWFVFSWWFMIISTFCVSISHLWTPFVFGKMTIQFVCPYFNQMDWLGQMGYYQVVWILCIYWMLTAYQIYDLQIFSIYSSFFSDHTNLPPFTFIRFWSKAWTSKD